MFIAGACSSYEYLETISKRLENVDRRIQAFV